MRSSTLLAASFLPVAFAAPYPPKALIEWTTTVTKSFAWFNGEVPAIDQLILDDPSDEEKTIWGVLKSKDEFSKLVKFIEEDEDSVKFLDDKHKGLTFFAPDNDAINRIHERFGHPHLFGSGSDDDRKKHFIHDAVLYATLPQTINYSQFGRNSTLATELAAKDGTFGGYHRRIKVHSDTFPPKVIINNYVEVTDKDIKASNGVIHKVNAPIFIPFDAMDSIFAYIKETSISAAGILKINLQDSLEFNSKGNKKIHSGDNDRHGRGSPATTFFVPTNKAWEKLPEDLRFFLFSEAGESTLRKLIGFHIIPSEIVFSEWVQSASDDKDVIRATDGDGDISFEWDRHFPTLVKQKLPVHSKKIKSSFPGSQSYNVEFQAHGIYAGVIDNPAQNGVVHVLDDVLSPRQVEGEDESKNAQDWEQWKDWLYDWSKKT
ncbi:hypothetical protein FRB99_003686, partial [Tulasnella sp. 403]